jgi:hypothetical protein
LGASTFEPATVGYCTVLSHINERLDAQRSGIAVNAATAATYWWNTEFQVRLSQGRTPREVSIELDSEYGAKLEEIKEGMESADNELITARDELVRAINGAYKAFHNHKAANATRK